MYFAIILAILSFTAFSGLSEFPAANASSGSSPFYPSFAVPLAVLPSPKISSFLASRSVPFKAFETMSELVSAMTVRNNSVDYVIGLYSSENDSVISVVGPPSLVQQVGVVSAFVNRSFPWSLFARAEGSTTLLVPSISYILWPVYFCFMLYFGFVSMFVLLINERENHLKLIIELAGIRGFKYFLSHFVVQSALQLVSCVVLLLILFFASVVKYQSVFSLIVLFVPFILAFVSMAGVYEPLFSNGRSATAASFLYLLFAVGVTFLAALLTPLFAQYLLCLVSPVVPFGLGLFHLALYEGAGRTAPIPYEFTLLLCLHLLFNLLFVGRNELRHLSCTHKPSHKDYDLLLERQEPPRGVELNSVSVSYPAKAEPALDSVSVRITDGCTALLGENGAGKTTLIKLLTGQLAPSSGSVLVDGEAKNVDALREMSGVVLQSNTLWDTLTVAEHLEFMLRLRGFNFDPATGKTREKGGKKVLP